MSEVSGRVRLGEDRESRPGVCVSGEEDRMKVLAGVGGGRIDVRYVI